jgi:hypothetical protein
MISRAARKRWLAGLAVLFAIALVAGTDGWIVRHFGARAASEQGPDTYLNAIACPSADSCWAVGQTGITRGGNVASETRRQLMEQVSAGRWHKVRPPAVPVANPALTAITCPGARDCWAVGGSSTHGSALIEHWAGGRWELVSSPRLGGAQLESVACATPDLCWAAGGKQSRRNKTSNVLEQWDGSGWSLISALPGGLQPVLFSCPISGHCLILGLRNGRTAAVRYAGGRWLTAAVPRGLPDGRLPVFLACSGASTCLTVQRAAAGMITEAWNGVSWTSGPASGPAYPAGLSCSVIQGCWLVGASSSLRPVAAHWQGGRWVPAPVGGPPSLGYLGGLACESSCWAVGGRSARLGDGSAYTHPLIAPVART